MSWYVKNNEGRYLDVWGGPALPGEVATPRWVTREDATPFTRRHLAYAAAGKYAEARVVRVFRKGQRPIPETPAMQEREAIAKWIEADEGSGIPAELAKEIRNGDHHKTWTQRVEEHHGVCADRQ